MLINVSNHPVATWGPEQREAAEKAFGGVVDMPFPEIPPGWDVEEVVALARRYRDRCLEALRGASIRAVHVMGEHTFTYALVTLLQREGVRCVAATTRRKVAYLEDGSKRSFFQFVRFRSYLDLQQLYG